MKRIVMGLLSGILFLTACGQATPLAQPVIASKTASPIPTSTPIPLATDTPTAFITPLPTIPTFTPTFDASTIVTVTPAPKAECPNESASEIAVSLAEEYKSRAVPQFIDLTNDGFVEIIIDGHRDIQDGTGAILIFSCQRGMFNQIENYWADEHPSPSIRIIKDLNNNGVPEIVLSKRECGGFGSCWLITVWEWTGGQFTNLDSEQMSSDSSPWLEDINFKDTNDDGTIEIIVQKGLPSHPDSLLHGPWRPYIATYSWNGYEFALMEFDIDEPSFRFEAVQDADYASKNGNFEEATSLYQAVIFSDTLSWWSKERYLGQFQIDVFGNSPTPTLPAPDSTEYPRLAAYAYYRIMLIHAIKGNLSDATTAYTTLQQTFRDDPFGDPYVGMAAAFWESYQSTHKMYDGCAAAIQYAAEHPEILIPLGSDYHGWQAKIYKPEDVCPFR